MTMDQKEFMEQLKAAGYECWEDDVVMIKIDYRVQSEAELRRFVKDVLCWQRSWGIFFEPKKPDENAEPAAVVKKSKPSRKGPKHKPSGKKEEPPTESVPDIPGQMSIFDFLGGSGGG